MLTDVLFLPDASGAGMWLPRCCHIVQQVLTVLLFWRQSYILKSCPSWGLAFREQCGASSGAAGSQHLAVPCRALRTSHRAAVPTAMPRQQPCRAAACKPINIPDRAIGCFGANSGTVSVYASFRLHHYKKGHGINPSLHTLMVPTLPLPPQLIFSQTYSRVSRLPPGAGSSQFDALRWLREFTSMYFTFLFHRLKQQKIGCLQPLL